MYLQIKLNIYLTVIWFSILVLYLYTIKIKQFSAIIYVID